MARAKKEAVKISITPPAFKSLTVRLEGTAPLMIHKFSEKTRGQIEARQTATDQTTAKRAPKDYAAEFNAARYISRRGWDGLPCSAVRNAMIGACRYVAGLTMIDAKGLWFIEADGFDAMDGTPLLKINGKAAHDTRPVRLESGTGDLRNRPRYDEWHVEVTISYDSAILSGNDIANLLARAGIQVGLCELRPQGKKGYGGTYGTFHVKTSRSSKLRVVA